MDPVSLVFTILGLVLSFAIAWWEHRKAKKAESRLANVLSTIPQQVANEIKKILHSDPQQSDEKDIPHVVSYADIDGDGKKELIIEYPAGVHGSALKVFDWRDLEFQLIGELRTDTPVGFEVGDFDNDGRIEVKTEITDWEAGLPYVTAPRIVVWYRWVENKFVEISRSRTI